MEVLLVTPSSRSEVYQSLQDFTAIEPPVWSGLIATYLRNRGIDVGILDAEALELTHKQTAEEIARIDPLLTVFVVYGQQPSASTQCMSAGKKTCEELKKINDGVTLVMGTHASAIPKETLENEPYTFVCKGEGPITIHELVKNLKMGKLTFENVPGLWYREGEIKFNKAAEKIKDLDKELPGQAWDLLDMSKYRAHNWHCFDDIDNRKPYASLQTSLGCVFNCNFCCINAPFGGSGPMRYWSPENIIGQIDTLVNKYGVTNIKIPDEMFVLNEKHVIGICDKIIERGYKLNIWAYARVDTVKERFLSKLKQAGFNWLCLGIESGNKDVRATAHKGRFGDLDIEEVVKKIRAAGIYVIGNYIFGLPDDTYSSMMDTLRMAKDLNCEWANFYSAMAYPGSQLYHLAVKNSWPMPGEYIGFSQHSYETLPLPTDTLSGPEVLAFRDLAHVDYFSDEKYQKMLLSKFGPKVLTNVEDMLSHTIKRKHVTEAMRQGAIQAMAPKRKRNASSGLRA